MMKMLTILISTKNEWEETYIGIYDFFFFLDVMEMCKLKNFKYSVIWDFLLLTTESVSEP